MREEYDDIRNAFAETPLLPQGSIINLVDLIDPTDGAVCTVKLIEQDDEDMALHYYYLYANNEALNVQWDHRIGKYYTIVEHCSPRIIPLSAPVM